jgi:hypothetical protein
VSQALLAAQQDGRNYFGFDRAFFGGFSDFASVPAENRAYIHLSPDSLPRGETFIRGHMALSTLRAAYPDAQCMTVLREPTVRLLSHFVFWRGFSPAQDAACPRHAGIVPGGTGDCLPDRQCRDAPAAVAAQAYSG